ncbi:MAG: DUF58 domain-containing protein [Frankia sp.]|nr:DUF58 domain-containing protein [Frankia sp.]
MSIARPKAPGAGAPEPAQPHVGATDPVVERTLRHLELTVLRRLDGLLLGDYLGLLPGQGSEKAESREYQFGDDVRRMDWAVTARTTVPHVHDLIADRELETWALVDLSASLDFGSARCTKRDLAIAAVAAVGFLTARTGNRMGAVVLTDAGTRTIPARPGRAGLRSLLRTLLATQPTAGQTDAGGRAGAGHTAGRAGPAQTDLAAAVEQLRRPTRRRGLAVVISDFLSVDLGWARPMRALAGRHDVLAIEIVDPLELELPKVGPLAVIDPETGERYDLPTHSRRFRARYAEAARRHREQVAAELRGVGAGHLVLRTDRDWLIDIARYAAASRRSRAARRALAGRQGRPGPSAAVRPIRATSHAGAGVRRP